MLQAGFTFGIGIIISMLLACLFAMCIFVLLRIREDKNFRKGHDKC